MDFVLAYVIERKWVVSRAADSIGDDKSNVADIRFNEGGWILFAKCGHSANDFLHLMQPQPIKSCWQGLLKAKIWMLGSSSDDLCCAEVWRYYCCLFFRINVSAGLTNF